MGRLGSVASEAGYETLPMAWLPVLLGLTAIFLESTAKLSGANTSRWLLDICRALWGQTDGPEFEAIHLFLRKVGHFLGYGTLSLLFFRAWYITFQRFWKGSLGSVRFYATTVAVMCTFTVGCLDEWHQSYLAGRVSSFHDVVIDTCGAVLFNVVLQVVIARRQRAVLVGVTG